MSAEVVNLGIRLQAEDELLQEMEKLVYSYEHQLSYAQVIGVLELLKAGLIRQGEEEQS